MKIRKLTNEEIKGAWPPARQRSAFTTNKERIEFYEYFTDYRPEKVLRHRDEHYPRP